MRNSERLFYLIFLVIGVVAFFSAIELPFITTTGRIGPGLYPRVLSTLLIVIIIYMLTKSFFKDKKKDKQKNTLYDRVLLKRHGLLILLIIIALLIADVIGFIFTLMLLLFSISIWLERLRWKQAILFSIITGIVLHLTFVVWLGANLPKGFLFSM